MSWIILEGIDRSGKSSVANLYKAKGFELIHMDAPDKKYIEKGYAGPSYVDDMMEMYLSYDNKDVIFDRSIYGECIWPHVYGRDPMLSEDDFEMLREFEDRNHTERILMVDPDKDGHWKRCVDNKEPLNLNQFKIADKLYTRLAHEHLFIPRQLSDFKKLDKDKVESATSESDPVNEEKKPIDARKAKNDVDANNSIADAQVQKEAGASKLKLEKANAINQILSKRVVKQKGEIYDLLEKDIRTHLETLLSAIFGTNNQDEEFSQDEIVILKMFARRIKEKEAKNG